jgi:formamidopyrimidine-DNA glycosylase
MPELPEVETIKRDLEEKVKGKKVKRVIVKDGKCIKIPAPTEFIKRTEGKVFREIQRRGKFLIIELDSLDALIIHLKLTGQLIYSPKEGELLNYTRLIFIFCDHTQLNFADIRRFGSIWLIPEGKFSLIPSLANLGPEPLRDDFTMEKFKNLLKGKKGKIKSLLMDQSFIAGIGNVYSQEALFGAGIHPERNPSKLLDEEIEKLYNNLQKVLREAIYHRGSSVINYVDLEGKKGNYEPYLNVYGRESQSCPRCGANIRKITISGRGTYFCPKCQK